jgi:hypothetical protein
LGFLDDPAVLDGNAVRLEAVVTGVFDYPTVQSASINSDGTQFNVTYNEAVTGQSGHSLLSLYSGVTLTPLSGDGTTTHAWTTSRTILQYESITNNYTPGNAENGTSDLLQQYNGRDVANNSNNTGSIGAGSYNELFGLGSHPENSVLKGWWLLQDDDESTVCC